MYQSEYHVKSILFTPKFKGALTWFNVAREQGGLFLHFHTPVYTIQP